MFASCPSPTLLAMSELAWSVLEQLKLARMLAVLVAGALLLFPHTINPLVIEAIRARSVPITHELQRDLSPMLTRLRQRTHSRRTVHAASVR